METIKLLFDGIIHLIGIGTAIGIVAAWAELVVHFFEWLWGI